MPHDVSARQGLSPIPLNPPAVSTATRAPGQHGGRAGHVTTGEAVVPRGRPQPHDAAEPDTDYTPAQPDPTGLAASVLAGAVITAAKDELGRRGANPSGV